MRTTGRNRTVAVGVTCLFVGGALGPPLAAFASDKIQEVVVANTSDDPVLTKAVGPTDVRGTLTLAHGITISGVEGDRPLPVTPVGRTEVGGTVGLADDAEVALADGTKVGLTDGTEVLVDQPIQLADDASVKINNDEGAPVPVEVVGGGGPGAQTPASFSTKLTFEPGETFALSRQREFTVPDGKVLVITGGYGNISEGVTDVGISRQSVLCTGGRPNDQGQFFLGTVTGSTWVLHGEPRITPGCPLLVFSNRDRGSAGGHGSVTYHVFGYLIDA